MQTERGRLWGAALVLALAAAAAADRYHPERMFPAAPGRVQPAERTADHWVTEAQAAILRREAAAAGPPGPPAKNVILFVGDGMSVPTLAAARTLLGQRNGTAGEEASLFFEGFPTVGLSKTYCVNAQIPDSACTATAYHCGVKTNQGLLGLTAAVTRRDCEASLDPATHLESIAVWALADGRDAGIVTTTRVTHASPAGAYAVSANRGWEKDADIVEDGQDPTLCEDIASQLVHRHPGANFKVILGGGRREFLHNDMRDEEGTRGRRTDARNLIEEWQTDKEARGVSYKYVWNRTELLAAGEDPPEYLLGLFEGTHLQYHLEGPPETEPTLAELTEVAIRSLSRNPRGFFLFVEGGRIDHAHHDNYPHLALDETIELDAAVARAAALLPAEDSLLVVTADHAHVMAFNGYTPRGGDILGPSGDLDDDGVPYMTLSYTNGPGARPRSAATRPDVTQDSDFGTLRWQAHAEVPLEEETHGGDDVAVFARGPHHLMFAGLYEQSQIPHLMAYAACLGPGRTVCDIREDEQEEDDSGDDEIEVVELEDTLEVGESEPEEDTSIESEQPDDGNNESEQEVSGNTESEQDIGPIVDPEDPGDPDAANFMAPSTLALIFLMIVSAMIS